MPVAESPIPSRPLLQVVSNTQLVTEEKANAQWQRAYKEQGKEKLLALAQHVRNSWDAAYNAKQSNVQQKLLKALRQRNGEYEPDTLANIKKFGGTDIYMMLTSMKCRAAESWIRDIILPPGEKPWSLDPTPVPDLPGNDMDDLEQNVLRETILLMQQYGPEALSTQDIAERMSAMKEKAQKERFKRAKLTTNRFERRINDDLVEGGFYGAMGEFVTDLVTFPTAFLKGPIIRRKKRLTWKEGKMGAWTPQLEEKLIRCYERVSPFDMFPSPGARSVQDGYMIERMRLRRTDLMEMMGVKGFSDDAIKGVLWESERGYLNNWTLPRDQEQADVEQRWQEWNDPDPPIDALLYWGHCQGKKLREWGMTSKEIPDPWIDYSITAILIGSWVIMARVNHHPMGIRPYYGTSFEKTNDSIWGRGVPQLMQDIQRLCNAIARTIVNNLSIASGPQIEVHKDRFDPGEDIEDVYPWKIWKSNYDTAHGKPAIQFWQANPMTDVLVKVYDYFFKQASEQSGIPAYIYGQENLGGAGKTAAGLSMLMNAASKTLKGVVAHIDDDVIKLAIREHWTHLMLYDNDIMKIGDINIVARASEHLIIAEQLQLRRAEFMQTTNNPVDHAIIGNKGRAVMLRESAKDLKFSEEVVPTKEEMDDLERAEQGLEQPHGGGGMPGSPLPNRPREVNAAGEPENEKFRRAA